MRLNTDINELDQPRTSDVPNFIQNVQTAARLNDPELPTWQRTYNCWVGKQQPFGTMGQEANIGSVISRSAALTKDYFKPGMKLNSWNKADNDESWSANPQIMRTGVHSFTDVQYPGGKSAFWGTTHRPFSNNDLTRKDYPYYGRV
jgi:hypothetical protein